MRGEYWTYEEVDEEGNVIARYESYDEIVAEGLAQRGWRKYDASGQLVDVQTVCVSWIARTETLSAFAA